MQDPQRQVGRRGSRRLRRSVRWFKRCNWNTNSGAQVACDKQTNMHHKFQQMREAEESPCESPEQPAIRGGEKTQEETIQQLQVSKYYLMMCSAEWKWSDLMHRLSSDHCPLMLQTHIFLPLASSRLSGRPIPFENCWHQGWRASWRSPYYRWRSFDHAWAHESDQTTQKR